MTVTENGLTIPAVWLVNWLWNLFRNTPILL